MIPDAPSDPAAQHTQIRGHQVAWTDQGQGPVIVAIHGLPGSERDWRWLGAVLEAQTRFIRLNMPGFGGTDGSAATMEWAEQSRFVAEVLAELDLNNVTLLGHSYGSITATGSALAAADRVTRLGFLAPLGLRAHRGFRNFPAPGLASFLMGLPLLGSPTVKAMRRGFQRAGFAKPIRDDQIRRVVRAVADWRFPPYRSAIESLKIPVLGAWCADDHLVEPEIVDELLACCPDGPRLRFDTGGHNIQKSRAIEIGEALIDWVQRPVTSS